LLRGSEGPDLEVVSQPSIRWTEVTYNERRATNRSDDEKRRGRGERPDP
jgi:hypothetical protein